MRMLIRGYGLIVVEMCLMRLLLLRRQWIRLIKGFGRSRNAWRMTLSRATLLLRLRQLLLRLLLLVRR